MEPSDSDRPDRNDPEIRRASPVDAEAIASVLLESFREFEPLYTAGGFAATTPSREEVLDRMEEGPIWIALDEGKIVGTASVVPKEGELYVRGMAVRPSSRGRGCGWRLLELIEDHARQGGFRRLFLSTTPFLDSAIRLYERHGFHRTDEGPHDLHGTPLFTMEKQLERSPR